MLNLQNPYAVHLFWVCLLLVNKKWHNVKHKPTKQIGKQGDVMQQTKNKDAVVEKCLNEVKSALESLKYGTITIVVRDGIPIQIDTTEKLRLK